MTPAPGTLKRQQSARRGQPKVDACRREVAALARHLPPHKRLPTTLELCRLLSVSTKTLDLALTELERENVIYRKHGSGIFAAPRAQGVLGLLCSPEVLSNSNYSLFWEMLIEAAHRRADAAGLRLDMHFLRPLRPSATLPANGATWVHEGLLRDLETGALNGLITAMVSEEAADWLDQFEVPWVSFAGPGRAIAGLDSRAALSLGMDALCGAGCRRVMVWFPDVVWRPGVRLDYPDIVLDLIHLAHAELERRGLPSDDALVRRPIFAGLPDQKGVPVLSEQEQGYQTAWQIFQQARSLWPDGIWSSNDCFTRGALTALRQLGVRPGIDVAVATTSNVGSPLLMGYEEELIRLEFDPAALVAALFEGLEQPCATRRRERGERGWLEWWSKNIPPTLRCPVRAGFGSTPTGSG